MSHTIFLLSAPGGSEWILILLVICLYFLPIIIANNRGKANTSAILALNLLLGWTFIGWIVSLIWALSSDTKQPPTIIVNNASNAYPPEYRPEKAVEQLQPAHIEVAASKTTSQQEKNDQLRQIKQLLDEGVLTKEEFSNQKAVILG